MKTRLLLCLFCAFSLQIFARDIYVAKGGDDANDGTEANPYLTIAKAAEEAVAGDIVYIREGVYEETLTPLNSGAAGMPIIFQSYPGERVVISAMEALSGWTQEAGSVYKTSIPFSSLGQENFVMHVETACDLARWPNKTSDNPFELGTLRNTGGSGENVINGAYLTENTIPNIDWTGGAVWFYGDRPGSGWLAWKRIITSSSSGRVNFNLTASQDWIRTAHPPSDLGDFYLEGVKEALDYQNEWYYDEDTDELFIQIPGGGAPNDGDVKMRRRRETINLQNKKYIEIRNLAVFGGIINIEDDTRWTTNSNTTNNILYGVSSFYGGHTQGAVDSFSSGLASIKLEGSNNRIEKCEIAFGASSGINAKGNNQEIIDNYIHDFNYLGSYDAPVMIRGIVNTLVKNNTVSNGGRDGLQYFGNDNEIAYNDVSRSNLIADDCALFYTVGLQPNTEIHHNWFHDAYSSGTKKKAAGIYLDNDAASFDVHHNVVWNTEWTAVQINWNGTDINVYNNTFFNNEAVMGAWHLAGTSFSNVNVWNNLGGDDNWEPQSDKQNNLVVTADAFVSESNGDFRLKTGAPGIDVGKEIPGITDGFVGASPDIGAYEFGASDWLAGISWNPKYGAAGLGCYGLPGEDCITLPKDDEDKDGVDDAHDLCPGTPQGTTVNTSGCEVFMLPSNNFNIVATGETCRNSDNGSILIGAEIELDYVIKIDEINFEANFTKIALLENVPAGNYTVCITTAVNANYEQCFEVVVDEPEDLSVSSKVNLLGKKLTLDLAGSNLYEVELNGALIVTENANVELNLNEGENTLFVKTDKDCQGVYKEVIFVGDELLLYPNPVENLLSIVTPKEKSAEIKYQLHTFEGKLIKSGTLNTDGKIATADLSGVVSGVYVISLRSPNFTLKSKIVKK